MQVVGSTGRLNTGEGVLGSENNLSLEGFLSNRSNMM